MLLHCAIRSLRRSRGYTAACVAILALGIGANTAIFSLVYDAILKPLPYTDAGRLVLLYGGFPSLPAPMATRMPSSRLTYEEWQRQAQAFESIAAFHETNFRETGVDRPRVVGAELVSSNFLSLLGGKARVGRLFRRDEETPGADHVAVLSDRYFEQRFHRSPDVIGKSLVFGGVAYTVIGVLPGDFALPATFGGGNHATPEVFIPLSRGWTRPEVDRQTILNIAAKLKPGVTIERARAEMTAIAKRLHEADIERFPIGEAHLYSFGDESQSEDLNRALYVLLGAVGLVLLTGCANLANLTLARTAQRSREIAVRRALGASRADIVRQLMIESLILSAAGAIAGLVAARWLIQGLLTIAPSDALRPGMGRLSFPIFLFATAISVVTVLLVGLAPAWSGSGIDVNAALKAGERGSSALRHARRQSLTVAEVAMALVLLTGAGLLLRSFVGVITTDLGFEVKQRVVVDIDLPATDYPDPAQRGRLLGSLLDRVRATPGVTAAAMADALPLHRVSVISFTIAGQPPPPRGEFLTADNANVTPDYLNILGARVVRGRGITDADASRPNSGPGVVLVNQAFADKYLSFADPLGQQLIIDGRSLEVVGIVANFRALGAEEDIRPQFFRPGVNGETAILLLNSPTPVDALSTDLRSALGAIAEPLSTARIQPMDRFLDEWLEMRRFGLVVIAVFAGLALLLAMIGVHSVLANLVASRTREIGIRMALGSTAAGIARLVVAQSLRPVVIGLVVGLAGSIALGRIIQSMLFHTPPYDPVAFGGSILTIALATPIAIWWPVRRATRVECTISLREE